MKFVADVMLGKLARWLRLLGHDVLYSNTFEDGEIVRLADAEERIILTRDTGLVERRLARNRVCLIESTHWEAQLRQVAQSFALDLQIHPWARCTVCNGQLSPVPKEALADRVPPATFQSQDHFLQCQECRRIYWRGTHWERMQQTLHRVAQVTSP
jgi:uncharacterized protein with PIN domain